MYIFHMLINTHCPCFKCRRHTCFKFEGYLFKTGTVFIDEHLKNVKCNVKYHKPYLNLPTRYKSGVKQRAGRVTVHVSVV